MSLTVIFQARIWIGGNEVMDYDAWCYELFPIDGDKRSGQEWVEEHLSNYAASDIRSIFDLQSGNYQILFTAKLCGWLDDFSQEWDEDITVLGSQAMKLPDDYYYLQLAPHN
jgi:hypothetical protein